MSNRSWLIALGLLALPMVHPVEAAEPDPKEEPRIVKLDLSEVRPGPNKVLLPAPIAGNYKLRIANRVPTASYTVSLGDKAAFPIPPADLSSIPIPSEPLDALNCATLKSYPLGRLCLMGSEGRKCVTDERRVSAEVEKILEIVAQCSGLQKVKDTLLAVTTALSETQKVPSSDQDWEKKVEVSRTTPAPEKSWQAAISTCAPESQLEVYLKENYPAQELKVLAFDHRARTWSGHLWKSEKLEEVSKKELDGPTINMPRLKLNPKEEDLAVFVTNTNPLLFSITSTQASEANTEDLEALQNFTSLLGGTVASSLSLVGRPRFTPEPTPTDLAVSTEAGKSGTQLILGLRSYKVQSQQIENKHREVERWLREIQDKKGTKKEEDAKREAILKEKLLHPAEKIVTILKGSIDNLEGKQIEIGDASEQLDLDLRALHEENAALKNYLQLVESNSPQGIQPPDPALFRSRLAAVDGQFQKVSKARDGLEGQKPFCLGLLSVLQEAVRLARQPLPDKPVEQKLARDRFQDIVENISCKGLEGTERERCVTELAARCDKKKQDIALEISSEIARVAMWLDDNAKPSNAGTPENLDTILRPLERSIGIYTGLLEKRSAMLKTTNEALAKRGDIAKAAGNLLIVLDRRTKHLGNTSSTCRLRAGVVQVAYLRGEEARLRWNKVRADEFKLALDSGYGDSLALTHPAEATAKYEISKKMKWELDVDAAVIYTDLVDPVFTAVPVQSGTSSGTGQSTVTPAIITRTDEQNRAGDLAMFLGLKRRQTFANWLSVGPQLGIGLDADHPAIFLGGAFGIGRYVKLGVGWTWQEVKTLGDGQREGLQIPSDKDLKTRDTFDDRWYVSLAVTIDDLPFFKAPESK